MPTKSKRTPPMDYREGAASKAKAPEGAVEEERELEEEGEEEDMDCSSCSPSKRSSKKSKLTKDGECSGCKNSKKKCAKCAATMKDNCGSYPMKRNDALTTEEYNAACALGIRDYSRTYIRARLDAAARLDLKCGNGAISEGEKCHVGPAQKVKQPVGYANASGKALSNGQIRQIERNILTEEARTGKKVNLSPEQAALLIQTRGTQSRKFVARQLIGAKSSDLKNAVAASATTQDPMRQAVRKVAKRELFNRRVQLGARILGAGLALGAVAASTAQTRRRDSIYATGFSTDYTQLAI